MKYLKYKRLLLSFVFGMMTLATTAQISPLDYGLREATTGIERYQALYKAHSEAISRGTTVTYEGITSLEIELPSDFKCIPVGRYTDFGGVVFYVTNRSRHDALFVMNDWGTSVDLPKEMVEGRDFRSVSALADGYKMLILNDKHPWTERQGYGYRVYRKDILLLHNGRGESGTIAPWNTEATELSASYINIDTAQKVFKGLTLLRSKESTFRTYCLTMNGQYNVLIENVFVSTPRSRMIDDRVFGVYDCMRITFRDVRVAGTYSGYGRWRDYGYAFSMSNVRDAKFELVSADGNWGVFGTNNLANTTLISCDINRFDIHCYGRDALLERCTLRQRQTQFSSMYGTVTFDSCRFVDCIPVRIRSSYNAYTPFDIKMLNCTFELTPRHHSLVNVMLLDTADNSRPELNTKCWPNLQVIGMKVIAPRNVRSLDLFEPTGTLSELSKPVGYLNKVTVKDLQIMRPNGKAADIPCKLSTKEFKTINDLQFIDCLLIPSAPTKEFKATNDLQLIIHH